MHMVMFVLDDPERLDDLLDAWREAGITGVTIVESSGLYRRHAQLVGARYAVGFPRLVDRIERGHYTLFVIVDDEAQVTRCLTVAESIVGDLREPHTGVFAAWPLGVVKGTDSRLPEESEPGA